MGLKNWKGKVVTDKVTGLTGIVTAKVEYDTGCVQYLAQPRLSDAGDYRKAQWLDEANLKEYKAPKSGRVAPGGGVRSHP